MPIKAFKYRIYPNQSVAEKLQWTLDRCRELYNAALDERKSAYRVTRKIPVEFCGDVAILNEAGATGLSIGYNQQQNDLPAIKEMRPEYKEIGSHVLQNVLRNQHPRTWIQTTTGMDDANVSNSVEASVF